MYGKGAYFVSYDKDGNFMGGKNMEINDVIYKIYPGGKNAVLFYVEMNHSLKIAGKKIPLLQKHKNDYFAGKIRF